MTIREALILQACCRSGGMKTRQVIGELAEAGDSVTEDTLYQQLYRLVAYGALRVSKESGDGRRNVYSITSAGHDRLMVFRRLAKTVL